MTPDPCKSVDPNAQDLLDLRVWTPTDTIDTCTSSELGFWKTPGTDETWWASMFAMTFVKNDEGMTFNTFGVN